MDKLKSKRALSSRTTKNFNSKLKNFQNKSNHYKSLINFDSYNFTYSNRIKNNVIDNKTTFNSPNSIWFYYHNRIMPPNVL